MDVNDSQAVLKTAEDAASSLIADDDVSSRLQQYSVISEHDSAWSKEFVFDGALASSRVYRLALRSNMREVAETFPLATPVDAIFEGNDCLALDDPQLTFYGNIDNVDARAESLITVTPKQSEHDCTQPTCQRITLSRTRVNDRSWRNWELPPVNSLSLHGGDMSSVAGTKRCVAPPVKNVQGAVRRLFAPKRRDFQLKTKHLHLFDANDTRVILLGRKGVGKTTILNSMKYYLDQRFLSDRKKWRKVIGTNILSEYLCLFKLVEGKPKLVSPTFDKRRLELEEWCYKVREISNSRQDPYLNPLSLAPSQTLKDMQEFWDHTDVHGLRVHEGDKFPLGYNIDRWAIAFTDPLT